MSIIKAGQTKDEWFSEIIKAHYGSDPNSGDVVIPRFGDGELGAAKERLVVYTTESENDAKRAEGCRSLKTSVREQACQEYQIEECAATSRWSS